MAGFAAIPGQADRTPPGESLGPDRQGDDKGGPLAQNTFRGDGTFMVQNDFLAYRQAHAGSFKGSKSVQSLKRFEDSIQVLFIKTDPVVINPDFK